MKTVRRVVTGYGPYGRAVIVSDQKVESISPDQGDKWSIWAADGPVRFPGDGSAPPFQGPLLPAPGGFHITMFTIPARFNPDDLWGTHDPALREQMLRASMNPDIHPVIPDPNPYGYGTAKGASALHTTASIDCLMQVSGESVFVLEDTEIRLHPGDWLIVNGVPHSCRNDLDETAVLVGVVIGAHHDGVPLRTGNHNQPPQ
jgi:mannose-6-phosphate isomerase-like protein (cupin superfamily)